MNAPNNTIDEMAAFSPATCSANPRGAEADMIRAAYDRADDALRHVGKLLRTTHAGEFMWSADHKTAISGLRVVVQKLRQDVPYYDDSPNDQALRPAEQP